MSRPLLAAHDPAGRAALLEGLRSGRCTDMEVMIALALACSRDDTEVLTAISRGMTGRFELYAAARAFLRRIGKEGLL